MRYWWVNQNQTYEHEVSGGFLWSPKANRNGGRNQFYENMTRVSEGDMVFSFSDTLIKAVGKVQGSAKSASKPNFGSAGDRWDDQGWQVRVDFEEVGAPVKPKHFIDRLLPLMSQKYAPLQASGDGNQGVYLAEISEEFAGVLLEELRSQNRGLATWQVSVDHEQDDDEEEKRLRGRTDLGETEISRLVMARRGQGRFRENVTDYESECRVTGVNDTRFLIASHIKPWRLSDDAEKLDGCNGLLLAPHVDKLFDKGFISFLDDGQLLISDNLPTPVREAWFLKPPSLHKPLNERQRIYMAYHRSQILK